MPVSEERQQELAKSLKRCSAETLAAAIRFDETKNLDELPAIILGVLERDAANPRPDGMASVTDDMKLVDDIGMDSFGMIEVVMTAEEVLGLTIATEEMGSISTLGDLKKFLRTKLGASHS
ncbi:acyl carrier protein [Prosthecobacter vanneervenii]|uniref:Acyl carrier protein n=1 Tax=Prosthecobacter vanneervenii TaxID=48466 RepID=A0A7W8DJZ4_9BACT|nr:phosphopantetheine-binding protein [Prosthecobacter vanneervenii]MBB5032525.1 acyl carrier protein [Prosthecobacter vanneervenii]